MIQDVFNHLWQSTLFAGAAVLLALMLRSNRAHTRFRIWFAASIKFLIPFSLLVGLGSQIPHHMAATPTRTGWVAAFQEFSQPLAPEVAKPGGASVHPTSHFDLMAAGSIVWACGFLAVAISWFLRWRRIHALRVSARAVKISTSLPVPVPIMSAPDLVEPGVAGILRPVLLLPDGIAEQLNQTQLDAILAHEFCHLRRRDNLTAAIYMAVQAIFWFHPLTWWIGARLLAERERACDEEVLRGGCKANVYAESILAICRLYLSSPLACISGVTGSNLRRRIDAIMRNRSVVRLSPAKKLVLAAAGTAALIAPIVMGILNTPAIGAQDASDWQTKAGGRLAFEVASVKPSTGEFSPPDFPMNAGDLYHPTGGRFHADFALTAYLQFAFKIWPNEEQTREVRAHLPRWAFTDRYTIDARAPFSNPTKDQMRLMVQSLLAERFKLAAHFETHEVPVMALTLAQAGRLGPKLIPHADGPPCDKPGPSPGPGLSGFPPQCGSLAAIRKSGGLLMMAGYRDATMETVANSLAVLELGRTVIDKTGLSGTYDYTIEWAPEQHGASPSDAPNVPAEPIGEPALEALRDQLGLKVESTKGPVKILVIDRVERPSEN